MAKAKKQSARSTFLSGDWSRLRSWELAPFVAFYTIVYSVKELARNRGTILTASLAFMTALSVVPLLSVAVSSLASFGGFEGENSALEPYLQQLFPAAASDIAAYLEEFAATSAVEVAGIGAVAFFVIGFFLFISIERVFNIIWASDRQRPWVQKGAAFIVLMIFGPTLLSLSIGQSSLAQIQLSQFGVDPQLLDWLLPLGLSFLVFWAMQHFLPTTRVRWWASLLGGAFTALCFEAGKIGFNLYVTEIILVPYHQIYGAFGLFPLFLVWLYVSWIIVLFGAELAYTSQNLQTIVSVDTAAGGRGAGRYSEHVYSPLIGLELYAPIARAFKSGDGRVSERDLVTQTGYPEPVVRAVLTQLDAIGALDIVEDDEGERRLLPAKQLDDTQLLPVVDSFFEFEAEPNSLPMARLLQGYRAVTLEVLRAESALALIPQDNELSQKYAQVRPWEPLPPSSLGESSSAAWEEPPSDADLYESPPSLDERSERVEEPPAAVDALEDRETLDARPAQKPVKTPEPKLRKPEIEPVDEDEPPPSVAESDDGIRINTQDILVEEEDAADSPGTQITSGESESSARRKKKKQKEGSIEIDIAGMWDDFEVDNYDEILAAASEELESFGDVKELGAEKSVPPPMPGSKKK